MTVTSKAASRLLLSIAAIGVPGAAYAQAADDQPRVSDAAEAATNSGGLQDIIVTATRRSSTAQSTPIAISAIDGEQLLERGIVDPRQLSSLAPSLNVDQGLGNGFTHVSIRGLASTDFSLGANSPVATYIDDIYQPFLYGVSTQIFDLNRIEVLRGPQGTLFGRNTTGGALNYYSQAPTDKNEGYLVVDGGGGQFAHAATEGAFNRVFSDSLAGRLSFRIDRRWDYVDNLYNGEELGHYTNFNGRAQFAWQPSSDTDVNLKIFGLKSRGDAPNYVTAYLTNPCTTTIAFYFRCDDDGNPTPTSVDSENVYSEIPTPENYHSYGAVLRVEQKLGEYQLTSISNAQKGGYRVGTNDDGGSSDFFHSRLRSKTYQFSQELRLASPATKAFRVLLGAFAQYDHISASQGSGSTTVGAPFEYVSVGAGIQGTTALAAFGSATYDISDMLSLSGGLRYSYERKTINDPFLAYASRDFENEDIDYYTLLAKYEFDPLLGDYRELENSDKHSWKRLTWDVTANFTPSNSSLFFAKVASGFRSGGYPVSITGPGLFVRLRPETIMSYEVGFKTEWLNRMLRINGGVYYSTYDDQQVQTVNPFGPGLILSNAASSRTKGAELEIQVVPSNRLFLSGSIGYTDAKYKDYANAFLGTPVNLRGNRLPYAPEVTANLNGTYRIPLGSDHEIALSTDWTYRSRIYFDSFQLDLTSDPERFVGRIRASIGSADRAWQLTAYVDNVTNLDMRTFGYFTAANDAVTNEIDLTLRTGIFAPRRTWGLQGQFRF